MKDKPIHELTKEQRFQAFQNTLSKAHQHSTRIHVTHDNGHAGVFICPCHVSVTTDKVLITVGKHEINIALNDVNEFEFLDHAPIPPEAKDDATSR